MRISRRAIWLVSFLYLTGMLLTACTAPQDTPPPVSSRDPFSLRAEGEDGILLELSGNSRGHVPGSESAFDMRLVNRGQATWMGEYCLQLVDGSGVITTFEQGDFSLEPGEALSNPVRVVMPEEVEEGAYGLGVVITDRMSSTTTIYLGQDMGRSAGPYAEPVCP
jgi:uncharacterized membrane protein